MVFAVPPAAAAPPDPSAATVSPSTVAQGENFVVSVELFNNRDFTVTAAKAAIYGSEIPIVDVADLVSCTGTTAPCGPLGSSFRGPVGDLAPGETRTVEFTLRVKDTASPGNLTLRHQFVGDNYAFDVTDGPVLTITGTPQAADVAVALNASASGLLTSRITYTITVTNDGPSVATGVRVTANYAAGLSYGSSSDCSRVSGTRTVNCDVSSLAPGASRTLRFTTNAGLLALGSFTTTAQRTQSTPADPNPANDNASRSCSALTSLLVSC
jgi:uncharacterized repeat protein (TIGR01451 family)